MQEQKVMDVKLSTESIRCITAFESLTRVHPKDCLVTEDCIYFLVDPEKIGIAIGKSGSTIQHVRRILGKQVKVFAYYNQPDQLIKSMIPNAKSIETNNGSATISIPPRERSLVIGRQGSNINAIKAILKRHFAITEVRLR